MAIEPPKFGGRKDLVDRMAGRQPYRGRFEAVEDWKREQYARQIPPATPPGACLAAPPGRPHV